MLSGNSSVKRMDDAHMLKLEPKRRPRKRVLRVRFAKVRVGRCRSRAVMYWSSRLATVLCGRQAGRDVYLQAPSNETLLDWVDSFNEHIDAARAQDGLEEPVDSDGEEAKRASTRKKAEAAAKAKAAKEAADAADSDDGAAPQPEPVTGRGSSIRQAAKAAEARRARGANGRSGAKPSSGRSSLATGKGRHGDAGWDDETEAARRQSLNALLSRPSSSKKSGGGSSRRSSTRRSSRRA